MNQFTQYYNNGGDLTQHSEIGNIVSLEGTNNSNQGSVQHSNNHLSQEYEYLKKIIVAIGELKSEVNQMKQNHDAVHVKLLTEITFLRKQVNDSNLEHNHKRVMPKNPFTDLNEFKDFDKMSNSAEDMCFLEKDMSSNNFHDYKKYIRYIWSKLLSDNMAKDCSWRGANGKFAICNANVTAALRGAFGNLYRVDGEEVKVITAKYFQTAKDRLKQHTKK